MALAVYGGPSDAWAWSAQPTFTLSLPHRERQLQPPLSPSLRSSGSCLIGPFSSLESQLTAVRTGQTSSRNIAQMYRRRIQALNERCNAYLFVAGEPTESGTGPLAGAAVAVKDIFDTTGIVTTAGSRQRTGWTAERDATAWARLKNAGAMLLGKTNTHEFAAGTTNENEAFGPVHNPWAPDRISGGSSGGSAAAIAAGLAAGALGSDTAGSIRIPAACCGVVGYKPTYGRVSRAGVVPLSWSLDHVGPLARTVRDAALLLGVMAGPDPEDPSTLDATPLPLDAGLPRASGLAGMRFAVPRSWLQETSVGGTGLGSVPIDPEVMTRFDEVLRQCCDLGATVTDVDLGSAEGAVGINRVIAFPESAAYHAPHLANSPELYGAAVYRRLLAGRYISAEQYLQALRFRGLLVRRFIAGMEAFDALLTPTLPILPPPLGAPSSLAAALLRFCAPFNVTGLPAISIPVGFSKAGLPIGLQLVGRPWDDGTLLSIAASVEESVGVSQEIEIGKRRPLVS